MKRKYVWIYSAYAVAALVVGFCFLVNRLASARRHAYEPEDLTAEYAAWGIDADGRKEFVPLPVHVPYDISAASLGSDMFHKGRMSHSSRTCGECHPLTEGGADGRLHSGVFTRPVKNALFGKFYLHDGSVSNFPALVQRMIEDERFLGAGTLSNAVARLGEDGRVRKRFENCYGAGGLVGTNLGARRNEPRGCARELLAHAHDGERPLRPLLQRTRRAFGGTARGVRALQGAQVRALPFRTVARHARDDA